MEWKDNREIENKWEKVKTGNKSIFNIWTEPAMVVAGTHLRLGGHGSG